MSEVLFILTTIFVAYVVFKVNGEDKASAKSKELPINAETLLGIEQSKQAVATAKPELVKAVKPKVTATKIPESKITALKPVKTKSPAVKKTVVTAKSAGLKDPDTGEIATTYSNYRFTKRWIKEALVAEGLLEKVYVANELDPETVARIKEAIEKMEDIDKYRV